MPRGRHERPKAEDVDPQAMSVDATPDEVRMHGDPDEAETAQLGDGAVLPVEEERLETELDTEREKQADPDETDE